jgi:hypothetical protein
MIELTEKQHALIVGHESEPIPVVDPQSDSKYVLMRADLFERWKTVLGDDDVDSMAPLLAELDPDDWEDASVYESKP